MSLEDRKVLAIDDNSLMLEVITSNLETYGLKNIDTLTDPLDGIDMLVEAHKSGRRYDFVLLDLNMPGLDGMDLLTMIRQREEIKDTPVIIVSGDADQFVMDEAMEKGASSYITKPINFNSLIDAMLENMLETFNS